ncbi:MAG: hypothetical protein ABIS50_19695 [Luteolibacter sp.]|uniref:hypothetical protein n=1 Tax=Luteolibacter sp. TaxID=1962973 RepID=UPI003267A5BE
MKSIVPTLLLATIGFLTGFGLPHEGGEGANPSTSPARLSPRKTGGGESPGGTASDRMRSFANHAATLTPAEWPAFFRARLNDPEGTRLAERLWAEQDPSGFWDWLKQQHDGTTLKNYGVNLLQVWAAADPDAAMAAANAITDKECGDLLRREVIETVISKDLTKGLELAAEVRDFNRFSWGTREWMKTDPAAAVEGLAKLPKRSEYRDYLGYAVAQWAKSDSPALLEWLKTQSVPQGERWFGEAFKSAAAIDSRAALEATSHLADPTARDAAIAGVLASGKVPAGSLPELLSHLTLPKRSEATLAALGAMPLRDPGQFAEATQLLIDAPANRNTLNSTDTMIGKFTDWNQGLIWASLLPDSAMRRRALESLASRADSEQLDDLSATVATAPLLDLSNELFRNILTTIPDEQEAAWIAKLPPERAAWARAVAESQKP